MHLSPCMVYNIKGLKISCHAIAHTGSPRSDSVLFAQMNNKRQKYYADS